MEEWKKCLILECCSYATLFKLMPTPSIYSTKTCSQNFSSQSKLAGSINPLFSCLLYFTSPLVMQFYFNIYLPLALFSSSWNRSPLLLKLPTIKSRFTTRPWTFLAQATDFSRLTMTLLLYKNKTQRDVGRFFLLTGRGHILHMTWQLIKIAW